jgi:hypothetical protein
MIWFSMTCHSDADDAIARFRILVIGMVRITEGDRVRRMAVFDGFPSDT